MTNQILCKDDSSFFTFQPDTFSPCFMELCKICRPHVPTWTSWLNPFSFLSFWRRSRNDRFTFGPSEETWNNLLLLVPDKHALKDSNILCRSLTHTLRMVIMSSYVVVIIVPIKNMHVLLPMLWYFVERFIEQSYNMFHTA